MTTPVATISRMKAKNLTRGERLLISRRRDGISQREAAAEACISLYLWRQWETGLSDDVPDTLLGKLAEHEVYVILRTRAKIPLNELAATLGISRWWLCQMEYGRTSVDRLAEYWAREDKPWRPKRVAAN